MFEEKKIFKSQTSSLFIANEYLKKCRNKGINIDISPLCDFVMWADCIGHQKLLLLKNNKDFSINFFKNFIKELLAIGKNYEFSKFTSKIKTTNKINIVYSYCTKENFSKNGFFYDSYFNQSSLSEKNTYWFLISLDNYVPKKCNNVFIIYRKKKLFNFIYLIKFILKNIFERNVLHNCNNTTNVSQLYSKHFYETFNKFKFNLYLPYENRPHQNAIIKVAKKISKKNKVYGYYHRMPEPFQGEMIYKVKDLDKLYVCSQIQKEVFYKYLYWPKKKISTIFSIRYFKLKKRKNCIFVPFEIKNGEFYLKKLKSFLQSTKIYTNKIKVSIHPLKKKDKDHLNFKRKIYEVLREVKHQELKNKKQKNYSIILGEPGGVASECLQATGQVYHISDSDFDIFSEKIWKTIKVIKISDYLYKYIKLKKNNFLNINGKKNNFRQMLSFNKMVN